MAVNARLNLQEDFIPSHCPRLLLRRRRGHAISLLEPNFAAHGLAEYGLENRFRGVFL